LWQAGGNLLRLKQQQAVMRLHGRTSSTFLQPAGRLWISARSGSASLNGFPGIALKQLQLPHTAAELASLDWTIQVVLLLGLGKSYALLLMRVMAGEVAMQKPL
jgi:hypothetical protein